MFEQFHAKHPVHPVVAFLTTLVTLAVGMICSRTPLIFVYMAILLIVFLLFGFTFASLLLPLGMGILGIVTGGISALINGTWEMFWISPARMLLIGVCVVPLLSVPPVQLVRSLNEMHVPRLLTLGMLVTVRFIPILYDEIFKIRDAMRSRGIDTRWYSPRWYRNFYRAFLVPLVMRVVGISDTLSLSVETRAFDTSIKTATVYHPVPFRTRDIVFALLMICAVAALLIVRLGLNL